MRLEINPDGIEAEYLHCLNRCFPGWGDARMQQWAFRRALGPDPLPDLMTLRENGDLLAGSAVSYRSIIFPNGNSVRAGIMTGSWTLPMARGKGCFTRIIEESARVTHDRGGSLLLAFVTEDNPSCRQLLKAGAAAFPTWYFFAEPDGKVSADVRLRNISETELRDTVSLWMKARAKKSSITYAGFEDWKSQFVDRPVGVDIVCGDDGSIAAVERQPATDRVLAWWTTSPASTQKLFRSLFVAASAGNRKLFSFSTRAESLEVLKRKQGYLTVMVTDWERLGHALGIDPSSAEGNHVLCDADSLWFLGEWNLQSGDRM